MPTENQLKIIHNCLLLAHAQSCYNLEETVKVNTIAQWQALENAFKAAELESAIQINKCCEVTIYPEIAEKIGYGGNVYVEDVKNAIETLINSADTLFQKDYIREKLIRFFHAKLTECLREEVK